MDSSEEYERELTQLQQWINDLQSGMWINCVYCGHRYGPGETTPVSMADALKAHIEQCPKHPMSALKAEVEQLRAALEIYKQQGHWIPVVEDYWGYLNVERMGSVVTVAVNAGLEMDKGYVIAPLPEGVRVCRAATVPRPDWSQAPEWAQWWTVDVYGRETWHMREPELRGYQWRPTYGYKCSRQVDIPLGIDWRLLKTERPRKEVAEP